MRLLLIPIGAPRSSALSSALEKEGYCIDVITDTETLAEHALSNIYDGIIFDITENDTGDYELLKHFQKYQPQTPVLIVSTNDRTEAIVAGLDAGADDYVAKPYRREELLARIRSLTRRCGIQLPKTLSFGDLKLQCQTSSLSCADQSIRLGRKEYQLLELFFLHPNHFFTKEQISDKIWGIQDFPAYNHVEVYISFLRKKIRNLHSQVRILTKRNIGYTLEK